MTEERIGGISVGVGGSLAELEAVLAKGEQMVAASAARVGKIADRYFVPGGGAKGGGVQGAGTAASSEQLVTAINQLTQSLRSGGAKAAQQQRVAAEQVTINGVKVGRLSNLGQSLQKAIGPVDLDIDATPIATAEKAVRDLRVDTEKPLVLALDAASAKAMIESLTASATGLRETLAKPVPVASRGAGSSARARGVTGEDEGAGGPGLRRKNLRDRGVGTEVNPGMIYTYEPETEQDLKRQEAAGARARQLAAAEAEQGRIRANERLLRGVGGQLGRRMPTSPYDLARAYAPGPVPPGGIDTWRAPQARLSASNRPQPASVERTAEMIAAGAIQREREARRTPAPSGRYMLPEERGEGRAALAGGGTGYRPKTDEEIDRIVSNRLALREAQTVSAGRTPRTGASTLGGFFLGGGRQRLADENALTSAMQKRNVAERAVVVAEDRLRDPRVSRDVVARRHATEELAVAQQKLSRSVEMEGIARQRVQSYSGLTAGVRNLAGAALGGAAFGLGMEAVNKALEVAGPALERVADAQMGFMATSTRVTGSLAQQTIALHGNVDAAIAASEAQANLSTATAGTLSTMLRLPTQIKAGAQAQTSTSDLIRAAAGSSPEGLYGGYGGIGGSAILGQQLGGGKGYVEQLGEDTQALTDAIRKGKPTSTFNPFASGPFGILPWNLQPGVNLDQQPSLQQVNTPSQRDIAVAQQSTKALASMWQDVNAASKQGATLLAQPNQLNVQQIRPGQDTAGFIKAMSDISMAAGITAQQMVRAGYIVDDFSGNVALSSDALDKFWTQAAAGKSITPPALLAQQQVFLAQQSLKERAAMLPQTPALALQQQVMSEREARASIPALMEQQAYQLPGFIGQQVRTAQYAQGTQLPAQAYLANLANPPTRIGSTVAAAGPRAGGAAEQARINAGIKDAQSLQSTLDGFYAQGQKAVHDTYDPGVLRMFGQAGVQAFDGMIGQVQQVGAEMSKLQTSMNMEQAQYAAAQYTNEIRIAARSLTDIRQITGQIGATSGDNLGIYERQNLLLGRQAQQLGFMLSQRQINLQTAVAGFQVPGLTPAEQNARVEEAKVEAGFAQKQLDIQRKMFGNQVKIVDIGNLRQATDLVAQLGLLRQGRAVTLDIAIKQESLTRLNKLQAALMAQVNTYTSAVDSLNAKQIANLGELETAAGKFIGTIGTMAAKAAYNTGQALYLGLTGGVLGAPSTRVSSVGAGSSGKKAHASGFYGTTTGATDMTVGEAGTETVAILRNPRTLTPDAGMGGGGDIVIPMTVTLDGQVIYRDVIRRMGRDASLRGLRIPN